MSYQYPNTVIQVFCKAPVPGQVKTRLTPKLSAEQAAQVHQRLTRQTLALVTSSNLCSVQLCCSPSISHPFFSELVNTFPLTLFPQSSGDLGQRMYQALCLACKKFEHILLIGCDCPSLTPDDLEQTIKALSTNYDVVLAPTEDGGYCLIGVNNPQNELFSGILWGSAEVLNQTRVKIQILKLNCLELETQWDVDNYADYLRLINTD